ncbi:MAG TPA: YMGG-like glycine zipper-containing protein [Blastocatellia bacterium]|nr:YMGG-like glycine zipper-containing protein [Blastocatellia bacterium]
MMIRTGYKKYFSLLMALLLLIPGAGFSALAQQPYRVSDRQVDQLLRRIETRADIFRQSLSVSLNRSRINDTSRESEINAAVAEFESAADRLRERFRDRRSVAADVQDVLSRASRIESLTSDIRLTTQARRDWNSLRADLNTLASYYNVTWNDRGAYQPGRSYVSSSLTGTWRLDPSRSDNIDDVADRATRGLSAAEQEQIRNLVMRRLEAPDMLAIDQRGRSFTIASTRAPQLTFEADGRARTEYTQRNRAMRVNASVYGDQLVVSTTGNRGNDFHVTFDPIDNGQRLRVTRRIYMERLAQPIIASSVYDRTSNVAQLDLYNDRAGGFGRNGDYRNNDRVRGSFYVPNGTQLVAVLNNNLSTKDVREGDRFSMIVRSPAQYDGAVIEGVVTDVERSGRLTGRAEMSLDFESIRLRNGATYPFEGYIESIRTPNGDDVRVDNEGSVKEDDSQTQRTITRTGIGAALGAIIGAIAGGGKGAAIGAAIGAGAGAGSVFIQGRDSLDLSSGTELTIRASAPRSTEARRN